MTFPTRNDMNAAPSGAAPDDERELEIDLREYWRTILKYRRPIGGIIGLAVVLSVLVAFSMQTQYRSTATLLVESGAAKVVSIEEVVGASAANREHLQTQFEILKSRRLIEFVADKLNLKEHPEFKATGEAPWHRRWLVLDLLQMSGEQSPEAEQREALVNRVEKRLRVEPIRNSQLVKIGFEAHDPKLAADVANAMAEGYIESTLDARVQVTRKASDWLGRRLEELKAKLGESEEALKEYVEDRPVTAFESLPEVLNNPLTQRLKEAVATAERKVSELAERYGPEHPKMAAARDELAAARGSLKQETEKILGGLTSEQGKPAGATGARGARGKTAALRPVGTSPAAGGQIQTLQQDVVANRQLYNLFVERIKETNLIGDISTVSARIVDPAMPASRPAKPQKALIVGLTFFLATIGAVMLAFLLERFDNTLKSGAEIETKLGLPMLGTLPYLDPAKAAESGLAPENMFLKANQSEFAESIRTIRTGVMLSAIDNPYKVVLVTSSVPGEGKTTVAINLAYALGHLERGVLLIDADMRRPTIGTRFGLAKGAPGLSEALVGSLPVRDCIHRAPEGGIDVLAAGAIPPNPQELLSSQRFAELLSKLSEHYHRIVLDSAPTHHVSDALILANRASAVVYVVRADETPYQLARKGVRRLMDVNARVIGAVLNQVNFDKLVKYDKYGAYGGYYKGHYGYSYGENPEPAAAGQKA